MSGLKSSIVGRAYFIRPFFILGLLISLSACSLIATRPSQEMSDTSAAIRAAKEVQADTLSPEFYRKSVELFHKAQTYYLHKDFSLAEEFAIEARDYAERAEYLSLKNGATRSDIRVPSPIQESERGPGPH